MYQGQIPATQPVGLPTRADILQKLAYVRHKRIQLERQAYSLDDDREAGVRLEDILNGLPPDFRVMVIAALQKGCEK